MVEKDGKMAYRKEDTARMLGISVRKLEELVNLGEIRSMKVGKRRLFSLAAIEAFIKKTEAATAR